MSLVLLLGVSSSSNARSFNVGSMYSLVTVWSIVNCIEHCAVVLRDEHAYSRWHSTRDDAKLKKRKRSVYCRRIAAAPNISLVSYTFNTLPVHSGNWHVTD